MTAKSGVSLGSVKRFKQCGEISLQSLTKIAIALGVEGELVAWFDEVPFASIEEVHNGTAYDLTYSSSLGGEHATTINGNGMNPGMQA